MNQASANLRELEPPGGWIGLPAPRLTPPARQGLLFPILSLVARGFGRRQVPVIFAVLYMHRRLFWPWIRFAGRLMPRGILAGTDREKVILRMAWLCRSRYEWGQHVEVGLRVGLSDQDIVRVTQGPQASTDPVERALLSACDELVRDHCVSEATWAALKGRYDDKRLIEILMLAGHYQMLAGFLNSAGLRLEPPIEAKLQDFHRRLAG